MAEEYPGPERREIPDRRREHCALHDLLWIHHDKDKDDHRTALVTQIRDIAEMARQALPLKTFMIVLMITSTVAASAFGLLWTGLEKNQRDIKESLSTIHRRITDRDVDYDKLNESVLKMRWSVDGMSSRLNEVENRINQLHAKPTDAVRK